jgi:phosphatidate cytidylyltransferase
MAQFNWLTCPRKDLSLGPLACAPSPIFQTRIFTTQELAVELPGPLEEIMLLLHSILPTHMWEALQAATITAMPVQLHAITMACFASLISPFGGFFASGFKRAFKLKDFGDTIPGHGGIMDRFDCQVLMAIFSYLYYWNYIHVEQPSISNILSEALKLPNVQQLELFVRLGNLLVGEGVIPEDTLNTVLPLVDLSHTP